MKKLCFILFLALPLIFAACKQMQPGEDPWPSYLDNTFPGELKMSGVSLDTITPPDNPLHPLSTEVAELPCYYGYLDCARYLDNKRYCALIGMAEGRNVYFLADKDWNPIRYNSPLLANCRVGEILYIRGYLKTDEKESVLFLQALDIERTDSIVPIESVLGYR